MNLISKLKQAATLVLGVVLTVVMFPVLLATTTFLLMTGFVGAMFGAYKMRQLARQSERAIKEGSNSGSGEKQTAESVVIEGTYYVVHPAS